MRLKLLKLVLIVFSLLVGIYMVGSAKSYAACCPPGSHVCRFYCPYGACGECSCIGIFTCSNTACWWERYIYSCNCGYNFNFHCSTCVGYRRVCQTYYWRCGKCYTCANYACCSDCTPTDCDCVVSCSGDRTLQDTGSYCAHTESGSCDMGCGQTKTCTDTCYDPETNIAPEAPASADICYTYNEEFDPDDPGTCYDLDDITKVLPQAEDKYVFLVADPVDIPTGSNSRGIRYQLSFDGSVSGWMKDPWVEVNLTSGLTHTAVYAAGTLNRCDDGVLSSENELSIEIKVDNPPVISSSDTDRWMGTEEDLEIEGLEINPDDNNPTTYSAIITDGDGVSNIEDIGILLSSTPETSSYKDWETYIVFSMDYGGNPPSFYVMTGDTVRESFEAIEESGVYTLGEDLDYDEGVYDVVLNSSGTSVTYGDTDVTVDFNVTFKGDKDGSTGMTDAWEGVYSNMWYAEDSMGANDTSPGAINSDGKYFQKFGETHVDFTPPDVIHDFSLDECGSLTSLEACWVVNISEIEAYDSGIYYLDGVKYMFWPDGETFVLGDVDLTATIPSEYSDTYKITKDNEEQVTGVYIDYVIDRVGNVMSAEAMGITWEDDKLPWIRTMGGDVYGYEGFSNKILAEYPIGTGTYMSEYWLGGGGRQQVFDFSPGVASLKRWISAQYRDNNAYGWYGQLRRIAVASECAEDEGSGDTCAFETGTSVVGALDNSKGIYMINLSGAEGQTEEILAGSECSGGDKTIFIAEGTLNINPNFTSGDGSHCLFISDSDITILGGDEAGSTVDRSVEPAVVVKDTYDQVDASFIVDGEFTVESDGEERIEINGMVFGGSTSFLRSLPLIANRELPADLTL